MNCKNLQRLQLLPEDNKSPFINLKRFASQFRLEGLNESKHILFNFFGQFILFLKNEHLAAWRRWSSLRPHKPKALKRFTPVRVWSLPQLSDV